MVDADLLLRIQEGYGISEYQCERVQREAGIQFSSASSTFVVISNIKTKFVWNDGINLHCKKDPLDNSRDIFFHNVNASWNWDEGISAHDSFEYTLSNAVMIGNNYGLVNVESSKGVHYDLLLADSLDNEINFYTSPESLEGSNVFINSFVCFSKSHKHLTSVSKTMTPSTLAFENSVLLFPNSNPTNFTFSLSGLRVIFDRTTLFHSADRPFVAGGLSGPVDLDLRSSLFYFKNPSTLFGYTSSEAKMRSHSTLFAGVSSFILSGAKYDPRNQSALQQATGGDTNTRFTGGDVKIEPGSFQVEGRGADLSPSMKMRVKKYFDGTLLGAGFSLLSREILSSSMRFTFNLPVDALSLRAGIRIQDEKGFPVPDVDFVFSNGGKTVLVNRLKPGHRVLLTENLLSTLGPIGLIKLESFVVPTN
ncbi:MAG: hypothetical protein JNM63_17820 [Spirochaetia bacterium]|nr:hypothetical protein [Spirochaetia bacterium]